MAPFHLEPRYGVMLSPEQIETIYSYSDAHGDALTITDMRDKRVELNLPDEIKNEFSDFRGSVLVEQRNRPDWAIIVDRRGKLYDLGGYRRSLTQDEDLRELTTLASAALKEIHHRVGDDENWQAMNEAEASALTRALDAWDEFEQNLGENTIGLAVSREHGDEPAGVHWPADPGWPPPEGWAWVERCDESDLYEHDEAAARALIEQRPDLGATEVRWFDRETLEPLDDYRAGASCAINIPEPEEGTS